MLISDVLACAARAEDVTASLKLLLNDPQVGSVLPPLPVRLTLANVEQWLRDAQEAARKPRLAKAKKMLAESGIDSTSIPANVLDKTEELTGLMESLKSLPEALLAKARTEVGAALTKGTADAAEVLSRSQKVAQTLKSIDKIKDVRPWLFLLVVQEASNNPEQAESVVKRAAKIDMLLTEPDRMKLNTAQHGVSLVQVESCVEYFNVSMSKLNTCLVREGLGSEEIPPLSGTDITQAQSILDEIVQRVEREKTELKTRCQELLDKLVDLGVTSDALEERVATLRQQVQDLASRLECRRAALLESLGKETLDVLEIVAAGGLPAKTQATDKQLGSALRKLVDAGYRISLEIDHEDKR